MKTTIRIPCKEPYAYLETEVEGTAEMAIQKYVEIKSLLDAVPEETQTLDGFYKLIIKIMNSDFTKWGTSEDYLSLTARQKEVIQSIKRLVKRLQTGKEILNES